jgi:hypothetical protein
MSNPHAWICQYGYGDQLPAVECRGQQLGTGSDGKQQVQTAWGAVARFFMKHTVSTTASAQVCALELPCCANDPRNSRSNDG